MKKKLTVLLLFLVVLAIPRVPVYAKTFNGDEGWQVNFTQENKMDSNFTTANLTELIAGMQPGDDAVIALTLRNSNSATTHWYMTNEVISSLEDSVSVASGGAYTYQLTYVSPNSETPNVLFDSDTVGGEDVSSTGEGLNEVTDALDEFFFLDTLQNGQSGSLTLRVALDGETQGNDYQDTLAKLQMNFAVELDAPDTPTPGGGRRIRTVVKTGQNSLLPFIIAACVSGLVLLNFAVYSLRMRRKDKNGRKSGGAKRLSALFLGLMLCGSLLPAEKAEAAEAEEYTYTIRIFAGAQGSIQVKQNDGTVVEVNEVIYPGRKYGKTVEFDINSVILDNGSKYYVKGIRESGKDNNTAIWTNSIPSVTEDIDYVVAYGLKGSSVAYTVRYVDQDGNELAPSDTYYGNVGDKPVVSYRYVDGYQPQAYNVTKTLLEDPTQNIFTFTYTRGETPGVGGGGYTEEEEIVIVEGGPGGPAAVVQPPTEDIPENDAPAAGGGGAGEGGEGGGNGENGGNGPAELEDLDDQDVPLANPIEELAEIFSDAAAMPLYAKIILSCCVVLFFSLIVQIILMIRDRRKETRETVKLRNTGYKV